MKRLEEIQLGDIHAALSEPANGLASLKLTILRNITVEPIEPMLKYGMRTDGFDAAVRFGQFDGIMAEALAGSDLLQDEPDLVLVFTKLEQFSPKLADEFGMLAPAEVEAELDRVRQEIEQIAAGIRNQTTAPVVWMGFEPPTQPALGIYDASSEHGQAAAISSLNESLRSALAGIGAGYVIDAGACLARVGIDAYFDPRYWHIGRAPYSREALRQIAVQASRFVRALKGKARKCLILDCDNTLWGGVVGEDGVSGIKLATTHPGSAFRDFQRQVLSLAGRGVVLALCSKNNEDDVWEVFDKHSDMVIKREHIAAHRINWQDKAQNIREIAEELGLGLDHMVFADDSDFEVGLVREQLPMVEVIHLPQTDSLRHAERLRACGFFDTLSLTTEDRARGKMYAAEARRREVKSLATDMDGYLGSLEIEVEINEPDEVGVPRVAQLTQRTNQFNLTTRRYTEADIQAMIGDEHCSVVSLRVRDRFGDSGVVGVAIVRTESETAEIDALMMSCRVLGRKIEDALLAGVVRIARNSGASQVAGLYIPTKKNGQVARFYLDRGFSDEGDGRALLRADQTPEMPTLFKSVTVLGETWDRSLSRPDTSTAVS